MSTTAKTIYIGTIVIGIIAASFSTLPASAQQRDYTWRNKFAESLAQSTTADSFNFDELSAGGKGNWNFSSEDETRSIRDNLKQLGEYDISGAENFNIRLTRQNRRRLGIGRWANKGDRPYYSIDNGFYPYYFKENRIYNYY